MQQNFTAKRLLVTLALLSTLTVIGSGAAFGFTIDDVFYDLWDAGRWSNTPGSLIEQRERGLGGGIEYAIADDFCNNLIPRFTDEPKPTCEQLKETIQRTFDKWAAGHPI